jgi:endonuclease/exonuclease/phosphatase family metal-dependent hydrolase
MLGDFNAMHHDRRSKFLRSGMIKNTLALIPHKKARGRAVMLIEMASGNSLKFLESKTNLQEVDSHHRSTTTPKLKEMEWMPSIRMAQIDHIFVSPQIRSANFQVAKDGGSDHRAISVDINIKSTSH